MILVKLRYLWFCLICFLTLNNWNPLFAQNPYEVEFSNLQFDINNEFTMLADNICELLLDGYSVDEVIATLDDGQKHPYDIQKLVLHLYETLNRQNLRPNGLRTDDIAPDMDEKVSKAPPTRKGFFTRIRRALRVLFTIKVIAYLVIVAVLLIVGFLLYKYFYKYIKLIWEYIKFLWKYISKLLDWLSWLKRPGLIGMGSKSNGLQRAGENPQPSKQLEQNQAPFQQAPIQQILPEIPIHEDIQPPVNEVEHKIDNQVDNRVEVPKPLETKSTYSQEPPARGAQNDYQNPCRFTLPQTVMVDSELNEDVARLSEYAKRIGLEPKSMQFSDTVVNGKPIGPRKKFNDSIAELIEVARNMGLFPVMPPETLVGATK